MYLLLFNEYLLLFNQYLWYIWGYLSSLNFKQYCYINFDDLDILLHLYVDVLCYQYVFSNTKVVL